jgi:hypothetical protein
MAGLSREIRLIRSKLAMVENDINLLDQSISGLSNEFRAIRQVESGRPGARVVGHQD